MLRTLLFLLLCLNTLIVFGQEKYEDEEVTFEFENGHKETVSFSDLNPNNVDKKLIVISPISILVVDYLSSSDDVLGYGPFGLDLGYEYYSDALNLKYGGVLSYQPMDWRSNKEGKNAFDRPSITAEIQGHVTFVKFLGRKKVKFETLRPTDEALTYNRYNFRHRLPYVGTINVRNGLRYFQNGMHFDQAYRFHSIAIAGFFTGISSNMFFSYRVNKRYEKILGEIFIDLLYTPYQRVYGELREGAEILPSVEIGDNGWINDPSLYENKIGYRMGIAYRSDYYAISFELGKLAGPNIGAYGLFKIGFFLSTKKT